MTDKLKELVAKLADDIWAISDGTTPDKGTLRAMISCRLENAPQVGINGLKNLEESWRAWARDNSRGQDWANPAAAAKLVCADELEALLAEQAPAGELHPPKRKPINAECPLCQAKFIVFTLGPWRASDLAEPRDPAGK